MAHDLIGTAEVARQLDKSIRTIHRWVKDGRLKPTMTAPGGPHGVWLFNQSDVDAMKVDAA